MKFSNIIVSARGRGFKSAEKRRQIMMRLAACIEQFLVIYLGFMLARRGEALRTELGIFQGE